MNDKAYLISYRDLAWILIGRVSFLSNGKPPVVATGRRRDGITGFDFLFFRYFLLPCRVKR